LAILQKAAESDRIFFSGARLSNAFFGSFFYSGSAAAYVNLLMPVYAAGILRQQQTALCASSLAACTVCLFCNTSRIGFVVGMLQSGVLGVLLVRHAGWGGNGARHTPMGPATSRGRGAFRLGIGAVLGLTGFWMLFPTPPILQKWRLLPHQWDLQNPRLQAWRISGSAVKDASVWGMGAGCFPLIFPHYAARQTHSLQGRWTHAHCDYLELWIERGALGGVIFGLLATGTIRQMVRMRHASALCPATALAGLAVHALADFPMQNPSIQVLTGLWIAHVWHQGETAGRHALRPAPNHPGGVG
jgi:O-antigen ligase